MEGVIEVKYTATVYGPDPAKPGETKLLYKNKKKRALIDIEDIHAVIQYHNDKGKLNKNKCEIIHRTLGSMVLDVPFTELIEAKKENRIVVRGYVQYKQRNGKRK